MKKNTLYTLIFAGGLAYLAFFSPWARRRQGMDGMGKIMPRGYAGSKRIADCYWICNVHKRGSGAFAQCVRNCLSGK